MIDRSKAQEIQAMVLLIICCLPSLAVAEETPVQVFQAGLFAVDVTPTEFPVIVNGYFQERTTDRATDRLMSRALVLDDGKVRLAIVVVDNLMIPRTILDQAKLMAAKSTGIPAECMLISSTHTHSAPAAMPCLGSRADPSYEQTLPGQIAKSIILANRNLTRAKIGWTAVEGPSLKCARAECA